MSDRQEKNKGPDQANIEEAYKTLKDWVKSAPGTVEELKKNGTKEDLKKYLSKIKMVIQKMQDIESALRKKEQ
mgnify:CR=1 FL=1